MEYVTLNNEVKCPVVGIGTFMLSPAEAEKYGDSLYFTYWFNTDFLCRCKSCLGVKSYEWLICFQP